MENIKMRIKKVKEDAVLPKYEHEGDAGLDLFASGDFLEPADCGGNELSQETYILKPGFRVLVKTVISTAFPIRYELQIRPRRGLALKKGISIVNSPGTVDAGYRGEIGVVLINHGRQDVEIKKGDKIAQAVLNKIAIADIEEVDKLEYSERGENGYGSSGIQ
ncbi:MAG: dUTP diphosphatase [Candidatus Nanoarchaeia archaeon]